MSARGFMYQGVRVRIRHIVFPTDALENYFQASFQTDEGAAMIIAAPNCKAVQSEARMLIDLLTVEGKLN